MHTAAKCAAGAALSILLVTALAGIDWLPFTGPRQTLQDLYHHHKLEQQDVIEFKSQPETSVQEAVSAVGKRSKSWTPSLRILQGPVILSPEEAPSTDTTTDSTTAAATPTDSTDTGSVLDLGPSTDTEGPSAAGPGEAAPTIAGAPGCVPITTSSTSSSSDDDLDTDSESSLDGPSVLDGPTAAPIPSAASAAPAPGSTQFTPVPGVLCQTGTSGGVFVPTG